MKCFTFSIKWYRCLGVCRSGLWPTIRRFRFNVAITIVYLGRSKPPKQPKPPKPPKPPKQP
eukprot:1137192-Pelagomonas_calceolata.AAC.5